MKIFLNKIFARSNLDVIFLFIVLAVIVFTSLDYKILKKDQKVITDDVILYYEYLPAAFIYHDLSLSFTEKDIPFFRDKVWKLKTKTGHNISKMTMGLAVMYSPFFLVAHAVAKPAGFPTDGYSFPYHLALIISSIAYAFLGLLILLKLLRKYFPRHIVAMTILTIGLGTNLYCYATAEPAMSHAANFFLFAAFIFLIDRWVEKKAWSDSVLLGIAGGLIILIRPSNGIIFLIWPLWKIDSLQALKDRLMLFIRQYFKMIITGLFMALVFLPQVLYWKRYTGEYFYYTYGEERFFFMDPVFLKGLFSYRKGWLIYTPVMVFSLAGIILMYNRYRKFFWPVLLFSLINLYIVFSWWCWWYGGSFGQRALIESYALLAFPFAVFVNYIFEKKIMIRAIFIVLLTLLISLNIFQTWQYHKGLLHWDSMSKKAYWATFGMTKLAPGYYQDLIQPDYKEALKGNR